MIKLIILFLSNNIYKGSSYIKNILLLSVLSFDSVFVVPCILA